MTSHSDARDTRVENREQYEDNLSNITWDSRQVVIEAPEWLLEGVQVKTDVFGGVEGKVLSTDTQDGTATVVGTHVHVKGMKYRIKFSDLEEMVL